MQSSGIVFLCSGLRLLVAANTVPSAPILVNLMMEMICSSEMILTRTTWCNIPEDSILYAITGLVQDGSSAENTDKGFALDFLE
jgi:hypothetical protein